MIHVVFVSLSNSGLSTEWDKFGGSPPGAERIGTVHLEPGECNCSLEDIGVKLIRCWALDSEGRYADVLRGSVRE